MLIDTHAHVNFNAYKADSDEVVRRSLNNNIWMINVGSQYSTSKKAVEMAEKYETGVFAAIGLHPIHLETGLVKIKEDPEEIQFKTTEEDFDFQKYGELSKSQKVVAIGECGFDYYWKPKTKIKIEQFKDKQRKILKSQISFAQKLNLPMIFHCRMAHDDLIKELQHADYGLRGVVHCFTGTEEQSQKYLEMGFYLGLNGIIFKLDLDEIIKKTPLEKILIETDCPYLTPPLPAEALAKEGMAGRNEPLYVKYVAEKVANLKKLSYEEIENITTQNAKKLFKIPASPAGR